MIKFEILQLTAYIYCDYLKIYGKKQEYNSWLNSTKEERASMVQNFICGRIYPDRRKRVNHKYYSLYNGNEFWWKLVPTNNVYYIDTLYGPLHNISVIGLEAINKMVQQLIMKMDALIAEKSKMQTEIDELRENVNSNFNETQKNNERIVNVSGHFTGCITRFKSRIEKLESEAREFCGNQSMGKDCRPFMVVR